jgi:cullin 3
MFLAQLLPCSDDTLLATLADRWSDHQIMTVRIQEILLYLERNYIPQHKKLSTYNLGLVLFRRVIVENPQLQPRITSLLLHNVAVDRAGGVTADSGVMRRVTSMLIELSSAATSSGGGAMSTTSSSNTNSNGCAISNVYHDVFERPFLDATSSYFRSAAQVLVSSRTCMECLVEIERRLVSEAKRAEQYLSESTGRKLIRLVELELIERTAKDLVSMQDSGVASMIRDKRFGELRLLYSLLSRVPMTLDYLRVCLEDFIRTSGSSIYSCQANTNDSVKFVEDLSAMMTTLTVLIDTCFASDNKLQAKINTALDELFSRDSILTVHHIVMYSDEQLRNGLKSASDTEVDVVLARIVALLRHVRDKDVFESYYKTHLSRRLLGSRSSEDVERQIVLRLKAEYGYQFTLKIERMFSDMSISRALMSDFKLSQYKTECPIECDFTVLTAGYWPAQRHSDDFIFPASYAKTASGGTSSSEVATGGSTGSVSVCNACMPPSVRACMDAFTSFYVAQHSGRRLTWQLSQASADTRLAINDANKYLVSMSAYQMMIFHLLNSSDSVTYEEISSLVRIPELELKRQLLSLCTPKLRLLNKSSPGRVRGFV